MLLVGKKDVSFVKDGQTIEGTKLFFLFNDENVEGQATDSIFCSARIDCTNLIIGDEYNVIYNKYGKPTDILPVS